MDTRSPIIEGAVGGAHGPLLNMLFVKFTCNVGLLID